MGREIPILSDSDEDTTSDSGEFASEQTAARRRNPVLVRRILSQAHQLTGEDLRDFLHGMLGRMTIPAKEAVTEILWSTLTSREQQLFDLPYFGLRWNQDHVLRNLSSPWTSSGVTPSATSISRQLSASTPGFPINRSRVTGNSRGQRIYADVLQQGRLGDTPPRTESSNPNIATDSASQQIGRSRAEDAVRDFEDQIFVVLMDAIMRAERTAQTDQRENESSTSLNRPRGMGWWLERDAASQNRRQQDDPTIPRSATETAPSNSTTPVAPDPNITTNPTINL